MIFLECSFTFSAMVLWMQMSQLINARFEDMERDFASSWDNLDILQRKFDNQERILTEVFNMVKLGNEVDGI